ncbi:MAG TPA: transglycosylase SLT domain-containing protein [Vicinamibacterales bacterium]
MRTHGSACVTIAALVATLALPAVPGAQQKEPPLLKPTNHVRLPQDPDSYWLAPSPKDERAAKSASMTQFGEGVKLEVDTNFAKALPIFSQKTLQQGPLGDYAVYYKGLAELRLGRPADAKRTFEALAAKSPAGYLIEGAALREAESAEALDNQAGAVEIYERLSKLKTTAPDDVLMRLGHAAKAAGDNDKAAQAFLRVVYEFPFSDAAIAAATELDALPTPPITPGSARYKLEMGRAERLFGGKRYKDAQPVFESLKREASGDDRELVDLRLAECDYFLKHTRAARDAVKPYTEKASRKGEALYFYAIATRDLGDREEYLRIVRRIVSEFPDQSWAEESLNNLATYYILQNEDEQADATFREMYQKYPTGHYGERAAWKVGWWAYRSEKYADTVAAFESAAANFPRSDYRPAWLYWSGRAHEGLKDAAAADARYSLVATDYLNSYYGRLAVNRLTERGSRAPQRQLGADVQSPPDEDVVLPTAAPENEAIIRALLALNLYDQAIDELRFAQKAWGDSAIIQATLGWIYNQRGDLRAGINAMKRAYPQYLAAGGEQIPANLLRVRFPVSYWTQIQKYSADRGLNPYMMAALIAQESNFIADIRSRANAYGLMQLLPSTGRQYAKALNRRFSISMLTTADTNLRMGTAYFADLVKQFGGEHFALATYNAGPSRVQKWISERPGVERAVFIDDIPFPETQDYVKKILGQAEDYRRLYGPNATLASAGDGEVRSATNLESKQPPPSKKKAATPPAKSKKNTKKKAA